MAKEPSSSLMVTLSKSFPPGRGELIVAVCFSARGQHANGWVVASATAELYKERIKIIHSPSENSLG